MRGRLALLALASALASLVAGCGGSSPAAGLDATPSASSYPAQGISFRSPPGWSTRAGHGHLVATVQTGQATVAIWRYPRSERLPRSTAQLQAARDALVAASHRDNPRFAEIKTAPTLVAGLPAVQIRARTTIDGQPRTIRSTHIYAYGSEIIVDAFADGDSFRQIDATSFWPLLRSLDVGAPRA
jgi:hypothetical protein